jgi:predicted nucleic acid-binding protein
LKVEVLYIPGKGKYQPNSKHVLSLLKGVSQRTANIKVEPVADYAALARIMARYVGLPCDYADASLIALAEQVSGSGIATIDQRDFSVYRLRGRRRFRILPGGG